METVLTTLCAQQLSLHSDSRALVDRLDLSLEAGEVLGILGPNGAGKSTLLTALAGLGAPATGQVTFDGHGLLTVPPLTRARHVGLLPQSDDGGFFGNVSEFVSLGRYPFQDAHWDLMTHLVTWELVELAHRSLVTLSGGERQRVRMAQLSTQAPQYYLLDEPLTHLDPAHQARLLTWVRSEADAGKSVVLTLHDPNWAAGQCDRLLFLFGDGRWKIGTPQALLIPTSLESLYGAGTASLWQTR